MKEIFIYLIEEHGTGRYKIGHTNDLSKRLKSLQTGNSNKLKLLESYKSRLATKIEVMLHKKYSYARQTGEWFILDENDIKGFITVCMNTEMILFEQEIGRSGKIFLR